MTFLPIVERELRAASRRWVTYWLRLAVALGAVLVGVAIFVATFGAPATQVGQFLFQGLSGLLLIYCLASGRLATTDCLSEEKREGTLGLLFLTDLKGHDVVLGKLTATSLGAAYGLLAVFPVLAIPLLMGGITSGEFWRMVLVLLDAFLFSLAVGMLGSAICRDFRRAMAANFTLLLVLIGLPPVCGALLAYFSPSRLVVPELFFSCPAYPFYLSADARYKIEPEHFWQSLILIHFLTWLLLLLASSIVPRSWQDRPGRAGRRSWRELWYLVSYGSAAQRHTFRKRLLDQNAFFWLAGRARLKPAQVWAFLIFMLVWWLAGWFTSGSVWLDETVFITAGVLFNVTLKMWVILEAGRQLAEDHKAGALELILSTPLSVSDIFRGQFLALGRQFLRPLLVVISIEALFMAGLFWRSGDWRALSLWTAAILMLVADMIGGACVAMGTALTAKSHHRSIVTTITRILVLPWVLLGLIAATANVWSVVSSGDDWSPTWKFYLMMWVGLGLLVDAGFAYWAWWLLHRRFRQLALRRYAAASSHPVGKTVARKAVETVRVARPQEPALAIAPAIPSGPPRRARKARLIWGGIVVALAACLLWTFVRERRTFPPPVVVPLGTQQGSLRVFSANSGAFLVLPDGSLWRWGQPEGPIFPRAAVPEQVGTNLDWVQVVATQGGCVGLRRDGTLWEWGFRNGQAVNVPQALGFGQDWVRVAASFGHGAAIRRDGTLWAWGDNSHGQLGRSPGSNQSSPVQVGTNSDWVDVNCAWTTTVGLKKDGTLWVCGQVVGGRGAGGQIWPTELPFPTLVCSETNWVGLGKGPGLSMVAQNRLGEVWEPLRSVPNAEASVAQVGRLVTSIRVGDPLALAYVGRLLLYEVRADGTLWQMPYPFAAFGISGNPSPEAWRQSGSQTNWVSVAGGGGTAIGLTSDGTVWTWGLDPGQPPKLDLGSRLRQTQARVLAALRTSPAVPGAGGNPQFQKSPRPLMRLVPNPAGQAPRESGNK